MDCAAILDTYTAFWRGDITGARLTIVTEPAYRQLFDHLHTNLEAVANAAVECIHADLNSGEELILPTLCCDFGTISTAKLYGGKVIPPPEGGMVHIEPCVSVPEELNTLKAFSFENSDFQIAVDLYRLVCNKMGTEDIFIRTPDFQGPMNTLAMVMDQQEMLMGMYTDPESIYAALDCITDTLIDYHQRLRRELGGGKVIGNIWPYTFLPEGEGISITQDMMPLLSPELYRDFEIPLLKRISDAFGGVQIHCCGCYSQHLQTLKDSEINILGLEFHHSFTVFDDIYKLFGDDIVYVPALFGECKDYPDYVSFAADLMSQGSKDTRFWFAQAKEWGNEIALKGLFAKN